jgi:hypothetical protein
MTIGWIFPVSNGGQLSGFNDGAMDHFKGDRSASIVRETVQNSLDVCADSNQPVVVSFSLDEIPAVGLKAITDLGDSLLRSRIEEQSHHGAEASSTKFYDKALELIKSKSIKILGIHDFNTTGLVGPTVTTKGKKPEAWLALVKGAGLSVKSKATSGGSFGHGSKAPIAASRLRSAFYYTEIELNGKTEFRFQGKSILQSHFNASEEQTQGTGYFGFTDGSASPLIDDNVPQWPRTLRENNGAGCGTSIYVPFPGLQSDDTEVWRVMKLAVLANFYYAILNKSLVVRLGNIEELNHENVEDELQTILAMIDNGSGPKIDNDSIASGLEAARTVLSPTATDTFESESFGTIRWFIRTGEQVPSKTVGLSRNGMLITTTPKLLKTNSFTGSKPFDLFVSVEGIGSTIMKSIENPEHNNIQFDRIDDDDERKDAEKKYRIFVKELKALISEHASQDSVDEAFISDLDDLFGGTKFDSSRSQKGEISSELVLGKVKKSKIIEGADTEVPDPDSLGGGQGVTGGDGENVTGGGEIPDPGGDSDIEGVKLTGRQVRDFRVVRQSESKNVISIFFTPVTSGKFRLSVYRSGETEKEPIKLRPVGEKEWVTSIELKALNLKNRILIKTEIHPEDFDFALEGVMINAN